MMLFVSFDGDGIESLISHASVGDNADEIRSISMSLDRAGDTWRSWALANGGSVIGIAGDKGRLEIPADKLNELSTLRRKYEELTSHTCTVGVGMRVSEADKALAIGKLRGKDRIVFWDDAFDDELEEGLKGKDDDEGLDLGKSEHPFRSAAFRHIPTGELTETGPAHNIEALPNGAMLYDGSLHPDWEDGFVDQGGSFHNRSDSAAMVGAHEHQGQLQSEDPQSGLAKNQFGAADGENTMPPQHGGVGEASQSKSDAGVAQKLAERMKKYAKGKGPGQAGEDPVQEMSDNAPEGSPVKDPKVAQALIAALQNFKAQAPVLEQIKQVNPEAYEALTGIVQVLVMMAQKLQKSVQETSQELQKDFELTPDKLHQWALHAAKMKQLKGRIPLKDRKPGCHCEAYDFPHRHSGGKCKTPKPEAKAESSPETQAAPDFAKVAMTPHKTLHHQHIYPVGSVDQDHGKVKIQHPDGRTGWVQVRAGQIMSQDGHAISARNPMGKSETDSEDDLWGSVPQHLKTRIRVAATPQEMSAAIGRHEGALARAIRSPSAPYLYCDHAAAILSGALQEKKIPHHHLVGDSSSGESHMWIRLHDGHDLDPTNQGTVGGEVVSSWPEQPK